MRTEIANHPLQRIECLDPGFHPYNAVICETHHGGEYDFINVVPIVEVIIGNSNPWLLDGAYHKMSIYYAWLTNAYLNREGI